MKMETRLQASGEGGEGVHRGSKHDAFTLIELLVSMTIVLLILGLSLSVMGTFSGGLSSERRKAGAFREARAGFEGVNRLLAQAMLNSYYDYDPPLHTLGAGGLVSTYNLASDLQFICGPATSSRMLGGVTTPLGTPFGHAAFFQAPAGASTNIARRLQLPSALSVCGVFVMSNAAQLLVPPMGGLQPKVGFSTLYQLTAPPEAINVYSSTMAASPGTEWFQDAVRTGRHVSVLAENVLVLAFLPLTSTEGTEPITPASALYDTKGYATAPGNPILGRSRNRLPPFVRTAMVVLDDGAVERVMGRRGAPVSLADLNLESRFTSLPVNSLAAQIAAFESDLQQVTEKLDEKGLGYRVFKADVKINQAK